jgi:hypothetical protein
MMLSDRPSVRAAILLDRAVARKLAPIGNSDSPDVVMIADLHRHALRDQLGVGKLTREIVERCKTDLITCTNEKRIVLGVRIRAADQPIEHVCLQESIYVDVGL